jgi:hypothetical protein
MFSSKIQFHLAEKFRRGQTALCFRSFARWVHEIIQDEKFGVCGNGKEARNHDHSEDATRRMTT